MPTWTCPECSQENPQRLQTCRRCGAALQAGDDGGAGGKSLASTAQGQGLLPPGPALEDVKQAEASAGERRLVTAVFADISGYTSLADRLDPEELVEVIDPVISALTNVVGRFDGHVDKFAGDALLCLFGAPNSHEDDPERALLAALEMQSELARLVPKLTAEARDLSLHIGVNTGHGIARTIGNTLRVEYSVAGDVLNVAQRLESQAPLGEVYVGDLTYELVRGRFDFEPLGELHLKGKAAPVVAWRLVGERVAAASLRASSGASSAPFVGRRTELLVAEAALKALGRGSGGLALVSGEPGVGKSRFTQEVRSRTQEKGMRWLELRCTSYASGVPYAPYADLVRSIAGIGRGTSDESARQRLSALLPEWAPYFSRLLGVSAPDDPSDVDKLDPEAFRRHLHEGFASWLEGMTLGQGLVMAIEDVHWADASSVDLTQELARICGSAPFLLYVTGRVDGQAQQKAIADGAGPAPVRKIALRAFDEADTSSLIEGILGDRPHGDLIRAIGDRTSGNPFFVEEVVRSLQETGGLVYSGDKWRLAKEWVAAPLPATVEEVLAGRMDLLPRPVSELLQLASVIGRRVPLPLLEEVRGGQPAAGLVDQLIHAGFLEPSGDLDDQAVVFHHALAQEVAYGRLLRRQRRDLHRRVAEVAEHLYGDGDTIIDVLARHAYLGEIGPRAITFLARAGRRAQRLFANEEAVLHLTRAVELARRDSDPEEALTGLLIELADLQELRGSYEDAVNLYAEVRESTTDVRAWRGMASTLRKQGRYSEALDLLEVALSSSELAKDSARVLWLERSWTLAVTGRFNEAVEAANTGLQMSRRRRDKTAGQLLLQIARAETETGELGAAIENAERAASLFKRLDEPRERATAARILGGAHQLNGDLEAAAAALREGLELAQRTGSIEEIGGCLLNLAIVEGERGALDTAMDLNKQAISEFERIGHGAGRAIGYNNLAELLCRSGKLDEALLYCQKALDQAGLIQHTHAVAAARWTMASVHLKQGRFDLAAAAAEEAARLFTEMGAAPDAAEALALASEALAAAGQSHWSEGASPHSASP